MKLDPRELAAFAAQADRVERLRAPGQPGGRTQPLSLAALVAVRTAKIASGGG